MTAPITLRAYQDKGITELAQMLFSGKRKVVFQLATGGGKTLVFSAICQRYLSRLSETDTTSILILVHRKELLQQTRRTLWNAFKIPSQVIVAGMRTIPAARVYVGMAESVHRRISRIPTPIGMVIIDEAHISSFNKLHDHFKDTAPYIIGFTATPLSASKKNPMRNYYNDIVCGVDIPALIEGGSLCQNITFAPRDTVARAALSVKGSDFDEGLMAAQFSKPRYVNNTVTAYEKWANRTKTIIFNVNIDHSHQVCNAFKIAGYNARHLDGTTSITERTNILKWFAATPDAVLCNVGVLTAGFDEPTIETVIFNRATMSMPLWLQCCGRGARPTDAKSAFTIIDMGGNALTHGDWCDPRDWYNIFHNPPKARETDGVAPVKNCPECDAIIPATTRTCKHCGFEFPSKEQEMEEQLGDFVVVTKGIDVAGLIRDNTHRKQYYPFFKIGKDLALQARNTVPIMTMEVAEFILDRYNTLAKEWCEKTGIKHNAWHRERARETLFQELAGHFKKWAAANNIVPTTATKPNAPAPGPQPGPTAHQPHLPWITVSPIQPLQTI